MVALSVILFPPLLIAFLLVMERVEEPLRRPAGPREVSEFLSTATPGEVDTLATSACSPDPKIRNSGPATKRPMIATIIMPRKSRRLSVTGSLNSTMPRIAAPTAPMPTHTP